MSTVHPETCLLRSDLQQVDDAIADIEDTTPSTTP